MNRPLTALFSVLEAVLVAAIGVAIPLVPLTVLWAFQYGLQIDFIVFWRTAVDLWLLGSGVDIRLTLDPVMAAGLGFDGAGTPFVVSIAPLGFALVTVLLGVRAGRRIGETPHRLLGMGVSIAAFAAISLGLTLSVLLPAARPSIWQGTLLPTLVFALGIVIGSEILRPASVAADVLGNRARSILRGWRPEVRTLVAAGLRGGVASASAVIAASALTVAVLLLANYAGIISLYESVHAGVLGGIALTIGQLAVLPNLVIWGASWFIGPGFALGTGSSVTPLGTTLGPIPAIPIFGALPAPGALGWGFLGLLVPVLAGFFVALALRSRLVRDLGPRASARSFLAAGLASGVVGGILLGLLAWASAGSAGPGRLVDVGPSPWLVGGFAALEIGVATVIGLLAGRPSRR
ncbi:MAG: hypothetical protein H7279_01695 [Microbacteriaceae bacterium]|nr:hypothetical protein [Microbacteriaceae bacterium]